jgi:hypothetical protein
MIVYRRNGLGGSFHQDRVGFPAWSHALFI